MACDITYKVGDGKVTFYLAGEITAVNANEVENKVNEILSPLGENEVVLDFENVAYIASSGLRAVLSLKKKYPKFRVIKANEDVYNVFEMTGFTEIVDVSRMYRVVSIKGLELLGEGYIGKVYRLDEDRIIKVFIRIQSKEDIYRERRMSKKAFVFGLPTAISYEIVKVEEGGYGMIYEMLKSDCLNKAMIRHPEDYGKYSKLYTDLLKKIITTKVPEGELPNKKDTAKKWFAGLRKYHGFEEKVIDKLERMVMELPDTNTMIHGDFHIKNIMLQGEEPLLIDMETLGVGHPIFEFAAFFLSYIGYPSTDPGNIKSFFGVEKEVAENLYEDSFNAIYGDRPKDEQKDIREKIMLLAYAWLAYCVYVDDPGNVARLKHSQEVVLSLIDKHDSLYF